eukprot:snap_masked-scaffold_4-processed-gene-1.14-mRNA-1 protein AED:1.00 eAED:1.00 QI:0/0/0/0/1/1/2/0/203
MDECIHTVNLLLPKRNKYEIPLDIESAWSGLLDTDRLIIFLRSPSREITRVQGQVGKVGVVYESKHTIRNRIRLPSQFIIVKYELKKVNEEKKKLVFLRSEIIGDQIRQRETEEYRLKKNKRNVNSCILVKKNKLIISSGTSKLFWARLSIISISEKVDVYIRRRNRDFSDFFRYNFSSDSNDESIENIEIWTQSILVNEINV